MSAVFAALPMYEWPELRGEVDAEWAGIRRRLLAAGVEAPETLTRRNADMPPVPGGIRDAAGKVIAPDPATLPPDELDLPTLWRHPGLLFGQTCWGPMELGLGGQVRVVGQPDYSVYEGGEGELYSSAILMRKDSPPSRGRWPEGPEGVGEGNARHNDGGEAGRPDPTRPLRGHPPLDREGGATTTPVELLRGMRLAFNSHDSMSGLIALTRDLGALGAGLDLFAARLETGAHRASIIAVAEGRADVCAIDCRTWDMAKRFEPRAAELHVVGWTAKRKGLPYISSMALPAYALPPA